MIYVERIKLYDTLTGTIVNCCKFVQNNVFILKEIYTAKLDELKINWNMENYAYVYTRNCLPKLKQFCFYYAMQGYNHAYAWFNFIAVGSFFHSKSGLIHEKVFKNYLDMFKAYG